jgi:formylglycine-generating enzyme required for sulfatase activity
MRNIKFEAAVIPVIMALLLLSCGDDKKTTNTPNSFTPAGMVLIQAKDVSFQMGSIAGLDDEAPVHSVTFTGNFWMDTTEVTQDDYQTLMSQAYSGYTTPSWHDPYGLGAHYPAYYVTWGDAALYCNARSLRDGLDTIYTYSAIVGTPGNMCELSDVVSDLTKSGYSLPTEAQWEFAARGGATTDFSWGKDYDPYPETESDSAEVSNYAIWCMNSWQYGAEESAFGTHQVASKLPNAYSLYDMAGNLYEWCNDWYGEYSSASATDPAGPTTGDWRCVRGGSWGNFPLHLRSSNRTFFIPDYQYYFVGFRAVVPAQ